MFAISTKSNDFLSFLSFLVEGLMAFNKLLIMVLIIYTSVIISKEFFYMKEGSMSRIKFFYSSCFVIFWRTDYAPLCSYNV